VRGAHRAKPTGRAPTLSLVNGEQPLGPRRLDFGALSDDDFEVLCYLVVLLEFPDAVRLRAPDLGADSALPASTGRDYVRCWQAKRFTGHIGWGQCLESLDRAVANYGMPHYTFCFARDLTGGQEQSFKQRLGGRHTGVTVDYWAASRLLGALLTSAEGQRIANHFYPDPAQNSGALMQAIRAAGPLETGDDARDRLRAVAEWLASHDPFFSYPLHTRETGIAGPGLTPGAVIAIEEIGPDVTNRIEAVPRNEAAMDEYGPAGTLLFEGTEAGRRALETFQRAFESGEKVTISEGVGLRFERLPPLMKSHVSDDPMDGVEITIGPSAPTPPRRWPARLVARSDAGTGEIEIDLEPVQPPASCDGALQGSRGGLTATLLFQRAPTPGVKFNFNFSYDSTLPVVDQLAATTTLVALHGRGRLKIHATDGSRREPFVLDFDGGALPPFFVVLHRLLGDVRLIEEWVGTTLSLPRSISREEMVGIAELAYIIRHGQSRMNFDEVTLELPAEKYKPFTEGVPGALRMVLPLRVNLFGHELPVGHLVGELAPSEIKMARVMAVPNADPPTWLVRLEPATEEARHPIFRFEREHPEPRPLVEGA
jgi:hypothetical protein